MNVADTGPAVPSAGPVSAGTSHPGAETLQTALNSGPVQFRDPKVFDLSFLADPGPRSALKRLLPVQVRLRKGTLIWARVQRTSDIPCKRLRKLTRVPCAARTAAVSKSRPTTGSLTTANCAGLREPAAAQKIR